MIQRIFRRKIYDKILKWKEENQGKTALLIEGARRREINCRGRICSKGISIMYHHRLQ